MYLWKGKDMKIFLTGDNHIGLKYASHPQSAILCERRISAFQGMVDSANKENCDIFVIAGDLFENTYSIAKKDIKTLLETLSHFRGNVVVLPGNHDYYDADVKVWQYFKEVMKTYDNITLITDYRKYKIDCIDQSVILYPAHCTSLHSAPMENNLNWIKAESFFDSSAFHIGIAHGAVEGETIDNEGEYFFMKRSELENIPVDIWLIGHTHVPFPRNLIEKDYIACDDKIFNAGTHVQTDVACNTDGECFVIEINEDKEIKAKKYVSGNIRFYRKNISVVANEFESVLTKELSDISDNSVVDVVLTGAISAEEYENRHRILENVLSRFIEGTYNDSALSRLITKELIESEFPETSFSAVFLNALLDDPMEAQLTYELLKSLKDGK